MRTSGVKVRIYQALDFTGFLQFRGFEVRCSLTKKHCVPCRGGVSALDDVVISKLLLELGGNWEVNDSGHLYKEYKFSDFMGSMDFANKVAVIAEQEAHHPDVTIAWGSCKIEIWTHKISGLTESDFILASKIDIITF